MWRRAGIYQRLLVVSIQIKNKLTTNNEYSEGQFQLYRLK